MALGRMMILDLQDFENDLNKQRVQYGYFHYMINRNVFDEQLWYIQTWQLMFLKVELLTFNERIKIFKRHIPLYFPKECTIEI